MATVSKWTPFGVALDITATGGTVTRTSATQFTVKINASWETYYSGAATKYGMTASSGGSSVTLKAFNNTAASSGSGSFTGTYSISGNGAATKTITVTFRNFNDDNSDSATKNVTFNVSVPAWTSYKITYNANGGSGAPGSQTKWKDQTLTLSATKPTRTGYSFLGWSTSSTATSATYSAGGSYTANSAATLYAVWKANTYTVKYSANGGTGAPANQTKTYGVTLTLSSTKPTRTNYTFKGWGTSASATTVSYAAGASYTNNASITLYAVWELSYKKPTISDFSVNRCTSAGTKSEDGTCALVSFKWTTFKTVSSVTVEYGNATTAKLGEKTYSASGTSGTVSQVISDYDFDTETTYSFTATVKDTQSTSRTTSMSGLVFNIDFCKDKATAIGKPAEELIDEKGNKIRVFDVNWRSKFRNHIAVGEKIGHLDGKEGVFISKEGYIHLQRSTAQGYHPYIGFMLDDDTSARMQFRFNSSSKYMEFVGPTGASGTGTYNPYFCKGMSTTVPVMMYLAGFVTNGGKELYFTVPFAKPIIGSPTVTAASIDGFRLRQNDKYTHGSSADVLVTPTSYTAYVLSDHGVGIKAVFSNTTNVLNNAPVGIQWSGTITFS